MPLEQFSTPSWRLHYRRIRQGLLHFTRIYLSGRFISDRLAAVSSPKAEAAADGDRDPCTICSSKRTCCSAVSRTWYVLSNKTHETQCFLGVLQLSSCKYETVHISSTSRSSSSGPRTLQEERTRYYAPCISHILRTSKKTPQQFARLPPITGRPLPSCANKSRIIAKQATFLLCTIFIINTVYFWNASR